MRRREVVLVGVSTRRGEMDFRPLREIIVEGDKPSDFYLSNIIDDKMLAELFETARRETGSGIVEIDARMGTGKTYWLAELLSRQVMGEKIGGRKFKAVLAAVPDRRMVYELAKRVNRMARSRAKWKGYAYTSPARDCPRGRSLARFPGDPYVCLRCDAPKADKPGVFRGFRPVWPTGGEPCEHNLFWKYVYLVATKGFQRKYHGASVAAFIASHALLFTVPLVHTWEEYERRGTLENTRWLLIIDEADMIANNPVAEYELPPREQLDYELGDPTLRDAYDIVTGGLPDDDSDAAGLLSLVSIGVRLRDAGITPASIMSKCRRLAKNGPCRVYPLATIAQVALEVVKAVGAEREPDPRELLAELPDYYEALEKRGSRLAYSFLRVERDHGGGTRLQLEMPGVAYGLLYDKNWPTRYKLLLTGTPALEVQGGRPGQ